ncbi:hypothetical protein PRIPAC_86227 [Pristionchus pacificus]|uniref:Uncharacterized protein n=1 Tax=Pristionchus pacificus TaxID=54126 RepID=A0A2A6BNB1_PRIPA|nr:hypothetical protein PRIPAC_86227 [Pristionchus pacificus]|eukprot:PDM67389.1 hypothetical protein PRIPAC_48806 [Pristionchus pacificus]
MNIMFGVRNLLRHLLEDPVDENVEEADSGTKKSRGDEKTKKIRKKKENNAREVDEEADEDSPRSRPFETTEVPSRGH